MSVIDQKRIAKNTLLLYVRMGLIMVICFFTSRVILDTLGEVDFGLYNVIGGIVVAFSFLNSIMAAACNRYFAIELGKENYDALKKVFSLNITIFIVLGGIIILLAETVGLWFLNAKMVIPADRLSAANWVYQFSILAFLANMISTPYRSIILSKEKMKVYAYSSIIEAVLRLVIVYALMVSSFDKLILYSILMFLISLGVSVFYMIYCIHFYSECRYSFFWDKKLFKEIAGYTGWQVIGSMAGIGCHQGINIVLNMFFGPVINAARGVAYQVYINVVQFVGNFSLAFNPQIYKSYATNEREGMMNLIYMSSKFCYYLMMIFAIPIIIETPVILDIWLKEVPEYTVLFCRLMLITAVIDCLGIPLVTAIMATGKVRNYQIIVNGTIFLTVFIAYFMFKWGTYPPETAFYIFLCITTIAQILRIGFMKVQLNMSIRTFLYKVMLPILSVTIIAAIIPWLAYTLLPDTVRNACIVVGISFATSALAIFSVGMNQNERQKIGHLITSKLKLK